MYRLMKPFRTHCNMTSACFLISSSSFSLSLIFESKLDSTFAYLFFLFHSFSARNHLFRSPTRAFSLITQTAHAHNLWHLRARAQTVASQTPDSGSTTAVITTTAIRRGFSWLTHSFIFSLLACIHICVCVCVCGFAGEQLRRWQEIVQPTPKLSWAPPAPDPCRGGRLLLFLLICCRCCDYVRFLFTFFISLSPSFFFLSSFSQRIHWSSRVCVCVSYRLPPFISSPFFCSVLPKAYRLGCICCLMQFGHLSRAFLSLILIWQPFTLSSSSSLPSSSSSSSSSSISSSCIKFLINFFFRTVGLIMCVSVHISSFVKPISSFL